MDDSKTAGGLSGRAASLRRGRRNRRALQRLTNCSLDLNEAHPEVIPEPAAVAAGLLVYPLLASLRSLTRRRALRRLPTGAGRDGLFAAYALGDSAELAPWPGLVRSDGEHVELMPSDGGNIVDLSDVELVTFADGVAWIDAHRAGRRLVTLALYAQPVDIRAVLPGLFAE